MGERGDLTQRGPVPVGVPWGPGLGAAASHSASHAPSLTAPGRFCLSLPGSTPAFQWAVGRRMRPDAPSAGPLPLGLETSLAPSPHWELGQPSCFPQSLPDSPPSWSHPSTGFTPPSHFLPLRVALGFCLQLEGVSLGPDSFLHFPEVGLSCGPPPSPHTLCYSQSKPVFVRKLAPCTGKLAEENVLFTLMPVSQMRGANVHKFTQTVRLRPLRWVPCSRRCGDQLPGYSEGAGCLYSLSHPGAPGRCSINVW